MQSDREIERVHRVEVELVAERPGTIENRRIDIGRNVQKDVQHALLYVGRSQHLFSETVPLNQNAGSTAVSGLLLGEQHSDIDIISAQLTYRFGAR